MIRRIFLDIDDVCNRFTLTALRHHGVDIGLDDYDKFPVEFGYEIVKVANHMLGRTEENAISVSQFWDGIGRSLWASCEPSDQFHLLIGLSEALVGRRNVCLLTSPTIDPDCLAGKLEWIHRFMPRWLHRQYFIGPPKQFCAHPEALLIDDADKNVKAFREWGGNTLLVPRPWNALHAKDTTEHIVETFDDLFEDRRGMVLPAQQEAALGDFRKPAGI